MKQPKEIKKVVNSPIYKKFKDLYRKGIYDKELYEKVSKMLNKALAQTLSVNPRTGKVLTVNYHL